jgi:hypothetical protein
MDNYNISPYFNVDDIHKVRQMDNERWEKMTFEEFKQELKENSEIAERKIAELRAKKNKIA